MPRRKFLLLALFILLLSIAIIASVMAQDNTLVYDEPVSGTLGNNDRTRWTFEAHRDDMIEVIVDRQTDNLIPAVSIYDQNNRLQAQIQGNADNPQTSVLFRIPRFGEYTVEIQAVDGTAGQYDLTVALTEPGLRAYEQGNISYGQIVTQRISDDIPYHFWTFSGRTGQVIDLKLTTSEGDLLPVLTLTSPGGDVIARSAGNLNNRAANLLAFRLPGDGTYRITARREGDNLGIDGTTSGTYNLELTLRNGGEATANSYTIGETAIGRITAESPLVRYDLPRTGNFATRLELSNPDCLADIAIMNQGTVLLDRYIAQSPFEQIITIPNVADPILEITTANCATPETLDFTLNLTPINVDLPIRSLPYRHAAYSEGNTELERWFIQGEAGDLVQIHLRRNRIEPTGLLRIVGPDLITRYTETSYANNDPILMLDRTGIYYIQISPNNQPYTLSWELVGKNGIPFSLQTPISEEVFDNDHVGIWQFAVNSPAQSILVIEDPQGQVVATAQSTFLNTARIDAITLDQIGRYRIKVFAETAPQSVTRTPLTGINFAIGESVKGSLANTQRTNRWMLPVNEGDHFNLTLNVLNPDAGLPSLAILNESGVKIQPSLEVSNEESIELIGIQAEANQFYQVLVSSDPDNGRIDYRLSTESLNRQAQQVNTTLTLDTPAPEGFAQTEVLVAPDYLAPPFNAAILDRAERINLPSQIRANILPNQIRQAWSLNVVRGQMLSITATSIEDGSAPGITLLDANRNVLLEHWERLGSRNQLLYRTPEANQYYIAITSDESGGRYLIDVETLPGLNEGVPVVRHEIPLNFNLPYVADFNENEEVDQYAFWASSGTRLQITALSEFGELIPHLELQSESGLNLAEATFDNNLAQIDEITLPQTGLYRLNVIANRRGNSIDYSRYSVVINLLEGLETNRGGLLTTVGTGFLGVGSPENTWLFYGNRGDHISTLVEPLSLNGPTPITVMVTDSAGTPFYQNSSQLSVNAVSVTDLALPRSGLYRIVVQGGGSAVGSYRIHLNRQTPTNGDHAINYSDTQTSLLTGQTPLDRWMLAGNAGDVIAIHARALLGDLSPVGFQLEQANGEILRIGADRLNGSGAREANILLPTTGIYYLWVGATDASFAGEMIYELSLQRQNRSNARSWGTEVVYGQPYTGTLYADDTTDVWLLDIDTPESVNITVQGDGILAPAFAVLPFNATLVDNQPQALLTRTGTLEEAARLVNYPLPQNGAYAIVVSGIDSSTGSYTLLVEKVPEVIPTRRILQDDLNYEDSVEGNEVKTWWFDGQAGDLINLTLTVPRRSSLIPELRILDAVGNVILVEDTFDGVRLSVQDFRLPITGSYTIQIIPTRPSISASSYTLNFDQRVNPFTTTVESFGYDEAGISQFSADNTSDLWTFEGQAGDVIHLIGARTSGYFDPILILRDAEGRVLAADDDSENSLDADIFTVLPYTGQYTVEIATYGGLTPIGATNNYRLDLLLEYRPATAAPTDSQTLSYGDYITATLDPITPETDEYTYWYFRGQAGDAVDVTLQFPADDSPLRLYLADGAGTIYQQGERNRDRAVIRRFELPADGTYTIIIERSLDSQIAAYYPYTLSLDLLTGNTAMNSQGGFLTRGMMSAADFQAAEQSHVWFYGGSDGEVINLDLISISGQSPLSLMVLSPDNRILLSERIGETNHNIPLTLPVDGLYQIVVINDLNNPFASYRIILNAETSQTLVGRLQADISDFGDLGIGNQEQVWLLDGVAGQAVHARASVSSGNLSLNLRLENSLGLVLANGRFDPYSGHVVLDPVILLEDGEYRLIVSRVGDSTGSYQIRFSRRQILPETLRAEQLHPDTFLQGFVDGSQQSYYSFFGKPNQPILIGVTLTDGSTLPTIEVLDSSLNIVSSGVGEIQNLYLPEDSYYLLRVTGASPTAYTIAYHNRPMEGASVSATQRQRNLQGNLSSTQPVDLWAIQATAGETLRFQLTDFSTLTRTDVVLYDTRGIPMLNVIEPADTSEFSIDAVFIPQTGTYTLRVGAWMGQIREGGNQYILRIEPTSAALGSEGGHIHLLGQAVQGGLAAIDRTDTWTFDARAGMVYDLLLQNLSNEQELSISLRNPSGETLDLSSYVTTGSNSLEVNDLPLDQTGTYTLITELKAGDEITAYSLTVSGETLAIEAILAEAQSIGVGETLNGTPDTRAWVFYAEAGSSMQVNVSPAQALTLIDADGQTLRHSQQGFIEPVVLLESGFYSLIVDATTDYQLSLTPAQFQANWRWVLSLGESSRVTLSEGAPLHEWELRDYGTGDYRITIQPTSPAWQARAFILDSQNNIVTLGESQPNGGIELSVRMNEGETYRALITSEGIGGSYDIAFDVSQNDRTPAYIEAGEAVTGRINRIDTADEWIWENDGDDILSIRATRTEGNFELVVRIYAPGNLFLQQFEMDEEGLIAADNIVLPVEGQYIIQVTRLDEATSSAEGLYELLVDQMPTP